MPIVISVEGDWEADALCTQTDLKRYLHLEDPTAAHADDTFFDMIVAAASNSFENKCHRIFTQASLTEYHDGTGTEQKFRVKNPPIASSPTPELYEDTEYAFGSDTLFTLNTEWKFNPTTGMVKLLYAPFAEGYQNIKIVYTGGFSSIPDAVQDAVAAWGASKCKMSTDGRWGLASKSYVDFADAFRLEPVPLEVQSVINDYRINTWSQ